MSYAGTYEPCPHDAYARNCRYCLWEKGGRERFERELPHRLSHPDDARSIQVEVEQITVYGATCPNPLCSWSRRHERTLEDVVRAIQRHVADCKRIADDWAKGPELNTRRTGGGESGE